MLMYRNSDNWDVAIGSAAMRAAWIPQTLETLCSKVKERGYAFWVVLKGKSKVKPPLLGYAF